MYCLQVKYNNARETKDPRTKKCSMLHALSHNALANERFKCLVSLSSPSNAPKNLVGYRHVVVLHQTILVVFQTSLCSKSMKILCRKQLFYSKVYTLILKKKCTPFS